MVAAGGFDAVFVVTLDASVLDRVEALWTAWPQSHPGSLYVPDTIACSLLRSLAHARCFSPVLARVPPASAHCSATLTLRTAFVASIGAMLLVELVEQCNCNQS